MEAFTTLRAVAAPLERSNVDTDCVIPARFLCKPRSAGLGPYAFHDIRFHDDGSERADFPLNQAPYRPARILVAGANFGCGSSRESAVWAIAGLGIRAIIAPSFGDIFYNNCSKNGILPIRLAEDAAAALRAQLRERPGAELAIDLPAQTVTGPDGRVHTFDIDDFRKECLIKGMDDIDLTLQYADRIADFESQRRARAPWSLPAAQ